jgi:FKBP-type peptidyl-prolyl cis-trans isomerase 2
MAIENGNYIKLSYIGSANGTLFDTTDAEEAKKAGIFQKNAMYGPIVVKIGAGHVLPGVDEDLAGKEVGQEYTIVVPAVKAFGEHKKDELRAVDKKTLPQKVSMLDRVTVEGREGVVMNKVGNRYLVDFNHPLAGQDVTYVYKIEEVVEDPIEKLAGMIRLITRREMKVSNAHTNFISIDVPPMMAMYNQNWMMTEYMITQEAFNLFPEIESVKFVETFSRSKLETDEENGEKKTE